MEMGLEQGNPAAARPMGLPADFPPDCGLTVEFGSCLATSFYQGQEKVKDGWYSVWRCGNCGMERLAWAAEKDGKLSAFAGFRNVPPELAAARDRVRDMLSAAVGGTPPADNLGPAALELARHNQARRGVRPAAERD